MQQVAVGVLGGGGRARLEISEHRFELVEDNLQHRAQKQRIRSGLNKKVLICKGGRLRFSGIDRDDRIIGEIDPAISDLFIELLGFFPGVIEYRFREFTRQIELSDDG